MSPLEPTPRVTVLQDGARMHYGLPLALYRAGLLERVFTEFYAPPGSAEASILKLIARVQPALASRMALRYSPELPLDRFVRNPWLLLPEQIARMTSKHVETYYRRCTDIVGRWVRRHGFGRADAFVGFVRNVDPSLCRYAQRRGLLVVGDQIIAPALVENRENRIQSARWPDWESPPALTTVRNLEQETWAVCDHLTAPSEYVKKGLVEEGVDPGKISVLPYPVAPDWYRPIERGGSRRILTVGFVGAVNLRKGVPYFFETARRLPPEEFRFVMVGPIHLHETAVAKYRGAVSLVGVKSRQEVGKILDQFDLFYFPSTCEGSAGSVMEAMMAGLPVVCSPNTGSLVRDGIDGYIVRYDDTEQAAERLLHLARNPELRVAMGHSARERAVSNDVDCYSRMWVAVLKRLTSQQARVPQRLPQAFDGVGTVSPIR